MLVLLYATSHYLWISLRHFFSFFRLWRSFLCSVYFPNSKLLFPCPLNLWFNFWGFSPIYYGAAHFKACDQYCMPVMKTSRCQYLKKINISCLVKKKIIMHTHTYTYVRGPFLAGGFSVSIDRQRSWTDYRETNSWREGDAWLCQTPWLNSPPRSWGVRKPCVAALETNLIQIRSWICLV